MMENQLEKLEKETEIYTYGYIKSNHFIVITITVTITVACATVMASMIA